MISRSSFSLRLISAGAFIAVAMFFSACGKSSKEANEAASKTAGAPNGAAAIQTVEQRVSYGIGYRLGSSIAHDFKADKTAIDAGLDDGLAGAKTRIDEKDIQAAFAALQQRMAAASSAGAEKELAAGTAFLAKNKLRPGVKVTASGLQYEVLVHGNGAKPKATDTVVVNYHGTLTDGTVFDSSVERGEPFVTAVNGVIPGWIEALQMMSVGDKWKLYIPPDLAYGPRAMGKIPANAVLIFEVELLSIK